MFESDIDDHSRTIIHIDVDCFYAQVEMNKNPSFRTEPLGVRQKNIVVTSNYRAREYGITKCMLVADARKLCPNLVLANGEDLHEYRQTSYKITSLLQKFSDMVERLGLDENFIDVTSMLANRSATTNDLKIVGNTFGDSSEMCDCGCTERLIAGTIVAQEMRDAIKQELNLTVCAGVAHNKLLAKIAGAQHKPDQQTVVFPNSAVELMLSLTSLSKIPGIGKTTFEQLQGIGIETVQDLHGADLEKLKYTFGLEKARLIYNSSFGIDNSQVKRSGKPQSIGLEDSCKPISVEKEVRNKLEQLLTRLLVLVNEDGRVPKTIKLTVRKYDRDKNMSNRETRQCNINPSSLKSSDKIMTTIMHLFSRTIDVHKPYHITLLGLSFTKFQTSPNMKNTLVGFLRRDLEVQSVISIENHESGVVKEITQDVVPSTSCTVEMDSPSPSRKKSKLSEFLSKKRGFEDSYEDRESPSKLKVAELSMESVVCPPDVDEDVFSELPHHIQRELWDDYQKRCLGERNLCSSQVKKPKPNTILDYFIRNK